MRIGIVGNGVVGKATKYGLERGHEILICDKNGTGNSTLEEVAKCLVIFICVCTPMKISGEVGIEDVVTILDSLKTLAAEGTIIVVKSTAVSGMSESFIKSYPMFKVVFNPEFLTDINANEDFINSTRVIIGSEDIVSAQVVERIYKMAEFTCPIIHTDIRTAILIKYACNSMLAAQISIANEISEVCRNFGVDYKIVQDMFKYDERIGKNTLVPGPDGLSGFGGKCFPKDINALIHFSRENGYRPYLLEEVWRSNLKFRK